MISFRIERYARRQADSHTCSCFGVFIHRCLDIYPRRRWGPFPVPSLPFNMEDLRPLVLVIVFLLS